MSENYFREIVDNTLRDTAREEGFQILLIGSKNRGEWEKYLKDAVDNYILAKEEGDDSSKYNVVCMALDFAKFYLVNANLMDQNPSDSFGAIDWMFNLESFGNDDTEEN
jgi:hypothetical protein